MRNPATIQRKMAGVVDRIEFMKRRLDSYYIGSDLCVAFSRGQNCEAKHIFRHFLPIFLERDSHSRMVHS